MKLEEYVRRTLTELVRIPSSAEDDPSRILNGASRAMANLGLQPKVHKSVHAVTASNGRGGVLLNGHLDTVPVGSGWTKGQGEWEGDSLYGRGTADMKAGCAAALGAARVLLERSIPFSLLFTTDEETTMKGSVELAGTPLVRDAAAVVVGEPTHLNVIASEKGVIWYHATVAGRSAHGSTPQLGDNAIHRMARVVRQLEVFAVPSDPFTEITVNVGAVRGGSAPNVVADTCAVDLDCRHPPGTTREDVEALLRSAFAASGQEVSLELFHEVPAADVGFDAAHVRLLRQLAGSDVRGVMYATEMAHYARRNRNCVVFGPGDPQGIHIPDERVSLAETVRAAEILAAFATSLAPLGQRARSTTAARGRSPSRRSRRR